MSKTPEQDKFEAWVAKQKEEHGLVDLDFSFGNISGKTSEDVFRQLNHILEADARGELKEYEEDLVCTPVQHLVPGFHY